jgi:DNA-binding XRE family transcriptional regulator
MGIYDKSKTLVKHIVMAEMKLVSVDDMVDKLWGKIGTPERDAMEAQLKEDVNSYFIGEAIKKMRQSQNLTQEELGERVGVQKAQISRLENGKSVITLPTMTRIFKALGISTATLDLGSVKVALW